MIRVIGARFPAEAKYNLIFFFAILQWLDTINNAVHVTSFRFYTMNLIWKINFSGFCNVLMFHLSVNSLQYIGHYIYHPL